MFPTIRPFIWSERVWWQRSTALDFLLRCIAYRASHVLDWSNFCFIDASLKWYSTKRWAHVDLEIVSVKRFRTVIVVTTSSETSVFPRTQSGKRAALQRWKTTCSEGSFIAHFYQHIAVIYPVFPFFLQFQLQFWEIQTLLFFKAEVGWTDVQCRRSGPVSFYEFTDISQTTEV